MTGLSKNNPAFFCKKGSFTANIVDKFPFDIYNVICLIGHYALLTEECNEQV